MSIFYTVNKNDSSEIKRLKKDLYDEARNIALSENIELPEEWNLDAITYILRDLIIKIVNNKTHIKKDIWKMQYNSLRKQLTNLLKEY